MGEGSVTVERASSRSTRCSSRRSRGASGTRCDRSAHLADPSVGATVSATRSRGRVVFAMGRRCSNFDEPAGSGGELGAARFGARRSGGPFVGAPGGAQLSPALLSLADRIELGHYRDAYSSAGVDVGLNPTPSARRSSAGSSASAGRRATTTGQRQRPRRRRSSAPSSPRTGRLEDSDGCPEHRQRRRRRPRQGGRLPERPRRPSTDPKKNGCPQPDRDGTASPTRRTPVPDQKGVAVRRSEEERLPESGDRDKDGIPDDADRCPDQPEDKDGIEDYDGCPDPDDDGDGIPDTEDACPKGRASPRPTRSATAAPTPIATATRTTTTSTSAPTGRGLQRREGRRRVP